MNFAPTRKSEWQLRQERGGGDDDDDDGDDDGKGIGGGYEEGDGILADDDPASCGPLTLHGMSRWLNSRGERFPAPGFPYDEVVWRPLEVLILRHFHKV